MAVTDPTGLYGFFLLYSLLICYYNKRIKTSEKYTDDNKEGEREC